MIAFPTDLQMKETYIGRIPDVINRLAHRILDVSNKLAHNTGQQSLDNGGERAVICHVLSITFSYQQLFTSGRKKTFLY